MSEQQQPDQEARDDRPLEYGSLHSDFIIWRFRGNQRPDAFRRHETSCGYRGEGVCPR
jgi:hypothetical protein